MVADLKNLYFDYFHHLEVVALLGFDLMVAEVVVGMT